MSTARVGLRFFGSARTSAVRAPLRTQRQLLNRRYQSTDAGTVAGVPRQPITDAGAVKQSMFQRLWTSEIGLKTVHFWAPVMKWALVLAGISDFFRPPEKLSLTQNLALMGTGSIWTRWCFIIKPKNVLLAAVNFSLAIVGTVQVSRIMMYRQSLGETPTEAAENLGKDMKNTAETAANWAETEVKGAESEMKAGINGKRILEDKPFTQGKA